VRRALHICAAVLLLGAVCPAAQPRGSDAGAGPAQTGAPSMSDYVGTWSGSWEGGGTGGFVLTLEMAEGSKLGGRVSVTGEPTYDATLKTVAFEGKKMTATYDFPPDPQIGIVLVATFEGSSANGTWSARQNGATTDVASGTWTVKKK